MTVQTSYTDWPATGLDWNAPPYETASPNLVALLDELTASHGGRSLGIHNDRPIRNGQTPSEHSWGAALDWRWKAHPDVNVPKPLTRPQAVAVLDWIVDHSAELGVCAIVDEGRSWRPPAWRDARGQTHDKGWIPYNSGYDGWAHIVSTLDQWNNSTPIPARLNTRQNWGHQMTALRFYQGDDPRLFDSRPGRADHLTIDCSDPAATGAIVTISIVDPTGRGSGVAWANGSPAPPTASIGWGAADDVATNTTLVACRNGFFDLKLTSPQFVVVDLVAVLTES